MSTLFPTLVYTLCFATSALCAFLLGRSFRLTRSRLLFWSALCFVLLAVVNFVVVLDMLVYPEFDLRPIRLWLTLVAVAVLLFGFIWDEDT
jgi:ABC-type nickel/cobalt efflux system permease component RcnA